MKLVLHHFVDGGGVGDPDDDPDQKGQDVGAIVAPKRTEGVADDAPAPLRELFALTSHDGEAEAENPDGENIGEDLLHSSFSPFVAILRLSIL
jgi:hypothetical protein